MDEVLNVVPSFDPLPSNGMQAPSAIVDLQVDEAPVLVQSLESVELNTTPQVPDEAYNALANIAISDGNNKVILVDGEVRICNMMPSKNPEKDFSIVQAFAAAGQSMAAIPPPKVDLRESFWVVKNQGSTGACAGFSASSLMEYCFTKTKRLNTGETVSPRSIWMAAKETDDFNDYPTTFIEQEGTSLTAVLKFLQRFGCIRESVMPFSSLYSQTAQDFYTKSAALRIASYYNLTKNQTSWKQWLAKYGPIYAAINVDQSWMDAPSDKILSDYDTNNIFGGHAVLICGYDSVNDYFIFKNSWGKSWGDGGYAYCSSKWCAQAVLEAYGVSV